MSASTARAGLAASVLAAFTTFAVELKNAALPKLVGLVQPLLADVESYAGGVVEQKLEQLFHYIASLPVGSEILVLAEGYAVKVVGNGLPQHGAGATLLQALEEALGVPSVIQPAATPEQIAAQSSPSQAGQAPVPVVPQPATPTTPAILQDPPATKPTPAGESIVQKVEGVLEGLLHLGTPAAPAAPVAQVPVSPVASGMIVAPSAE